MNKIHKILLNLDTRNQTDDQKTDDQTSAINYETGDQIDVDKALHIYSGILLHYLKGKITHLGSLGPFTTYLIELD